MFAELGLIRFQVIGSPQEIRSERRYDYAQHNLIEARPRLQWVGTGLERISFDILMHSSFTDPAAQMAALGAAAAAHLAMPLVFGNGVLRGYFVIESIATRSTQLSAGGNPIAITTRLELREWVPDSGLGASASAAVPDFAPLGLIAAAASAADSGPAASAPLSPAGVTALLAVPAAAALPSAEIEPGDVPAAVITRSAAL
jgi:phage protein U